MCRFVLGRVFMGLGKINIIVVIVVCGLKTSVKWWTLVIVF